MVSCLFYVAVGYFVCCCFVFVFFALHYIVVLFLFSLLCIILCVANLSVAVHFLAVYAYGYVSISLYVLLGFSDLLFQCFYVLFCFCLFCF